MTRGGDGTGALTAVVWDFDGTLVDTRRKNLNVTRRIVASLSGQAAAAVPALRSLEAYQAAIARSTNWCDLYTAQLGFSQEEMRRAGALWTAYSLRDATPTAVFRGIARALRALRHLRHGIVSQNARSNILSMLRRRRLQRHFRVVVGYEEVPLARQKPAPDGLLLCLERLTAFRPGRVLYIGDHETDIVCARRANAALRERDADVTIVSVGALYGNGDDSRWATRPDHRAKTVDDIVRIARVLAA